MCNWDEGPFNTCGMCHTTLCKIQGLLYACIFSSSVRMKNQVVHFVGSQSTTSDKSNFQLVDPNNSYLSKLQLLVLGSFAPI